MKYLKLFEKSYEIVQSKADSFKECLFEVGEIDMINSFLSTKEDNRNSYWIQVSSRGNHGNGMLLLNRNILILFIEKSEDEWYYVTQTSNQTIYKCDQMNGLIECIDKIIDPGYPSREIVTESIKDKMRYLKVYEKYQSYQIIDEDEYYRKTIYGGHNGDDPYEDSDYIKNNWESYTSDEVKEIISILPNGTKFTINAAMNPIYPKGKLDIMNINYGTEKSVDFFIVKLKDEWYYLYVNVHSLPDMFYKCDQISGLIKCIKEYL